MHAIKQFLSRSAAFKLVSVFIFAFAATIATAQPVIPGFQGKRFFVESNVGFIPAMAGRTMNNTGFFDAAGSFPAEYGMPISWRAGLGVHYVTGRHANIYLRYEYLPTGMPMTAYTLAPNSPYTTADYVDNHKLFFQLDERIASFGVELLPKTMLAPIGPYTRFGVSYRTYTGTIIDKQSTLYDGGGLFLPRKIGEHAPIGLDKTSGSDVDICIDFGYRTVIARKAFISWGLSTAWSLGTFTIADTRNIYITNNGADAQADNQAMWAAFARQRLGLHSFIMFNLGVGYPF